MGKERNFFLKWFENKRLSLESFLFCFRLFAVIFAVMRLLSHGGRPPQDLMKASTTPHDLPRVA